MVFAHHSDFGCFLDALQENLEEKGYEEPTLIQKCVIPIILKKKGFAFIILKQNLAKK
jgi:superfamily II DNA/RNA helicase